MAGSTTPWGLPTETSADTVALSQDFAKLANATNEALNDVKTQVSGAPTLPAAQSLDTITTDAVYGVLDSNGNPNRPTGELTGLLRTTQLTSSATYQVWQGYSNGRMFSRFKGSTGWSDWKRMDVGSALEAPILPAEQSVDSIVTTGRATVLASNANAGMPPGETGSGAVDTIMTGTNSGSQFWRSVGASKTMYLRFRGSLGWSSWTRVDAQYAIDQAKAYADTVAGGGTARPGTGFKVAPLALTVGGSGVDYGSTTGGVRMPMLWGADVTRFRVHIRNINPRFGLVNSGSMLLTGVWFGAHNGSGNFTGTPTQVAGSANTPSNGDEWVSPWVTTPMTAGTQYLLAYGFSSGAAPKAVVGGGWTTPSASDAANNAAAKSAVTTLPLDVWIEAETPAATPLIAWLGDSLSSGVGATRPVYDSVASQYARANGALPVHYTASGDTASAWSNPQQFKWNRWAGLARPDAVVMAFGSNDVFGGDNLATVQGNWGTVVDNAARLLSPNVYSTTVLPRDGVTGDQETTRRALNSWIKTQPSGVRDVFDIVPAVSSDDETLNSGLSGDGIHLSTAGYALVKGAIVRTLAPVMAAGPAGPAGSVSDTAVADLVSSGSATGTAFDSRVRSVGDARYAPVGTAGATDSSVADLVTNGTSTKAALDSRGDARYSKKGEAGLLNVKESFGALGNGTADDTSAMAAADAAANAGYTRGLFIPNGTYRFSNTMTAKTIVGENRQKTLLRYTGTGTAVGPVPGAIMYDRRAENFTVQGPGISTVGAIGLDWDSHTSCHVQNVVVMDFDIPVLLRNSAGLQIPLYNTFINVTAKNSGAASFCIDANGANENRFIGCRIQTSAGTGLDIRNGSHNIWEGAIEGCALGFKVADPVPGQNQTRANVIAHSRFENNTVNYNIATGVQMTAFIGNREIGGTAGNVDNGTMTLHLDQNTGAFAGEQARLTQKDSASTKVPLVISNAGTGNHVTADNFEVTKAGNVKCVQVYNLSSFSNARIQLPTSGVVIDRNVADALTTLKVNNVNAANTGNIVEFQSQSVITARVLTSGAIATRATTVPTDGAVATGEAVFWFDSTAGAAKIMFKAKDAGGTVRTASIPMT